MRILPRLLASLFVVALLLGALVVPVGATGTLSTSFAQWQFVTSLLTPPGSQLGTEYQADLAADNYLYRTGHPEDMEVNFFDMCIGTDLHCDVEIGLMQDYASGPQQAAAYIWTDMDGMGCPLNSKILSINQNYHPVWCRTDFLGSLGNNNFDTFDLQWYPTQNDWAATVTDRYGNQIGLGVLPVALSNNQLPGIEEDEAWNKTREPLNPLYDMNMVWTHPRYWSVIFKQFLGWPVSGSWGLNNTLISRTYNGTGFYCPNPYTAQDQSVFFYPNPYWTFGTGQVGNPTPTCGGVNAFNVFHGLTNLLHLPSAQPAPGRKPMPTPMPPQGEGQPYLHNGQPSVERVWNNGKFTWRPIIVPGATALPETDLSPTVAREDKLTVFGRLADGTERRFLVSAGDNDHFAKLAPPGTEILETYAPNSVFLEHAARKEARRVR